MADDAVQLIAALGGETITYRPYNGTARTFKAIVERRPLQVEQPGGHQYRVNTIEVTFPRHATEGVLTVQEGKDVLLFRQALSDVEAREYLVTQVMREDAGLVSTDGGMFTVLAEGM